MTDSPRINRPTGPFVPSARLDASQITDRRGQRPAPSNAPHPTPGSPPPALGLRAQGRAPGNPNVARNLRAGPKVKAKVVARGRAKPKKAMPKPPADMRRALPWQPAGSAARSTPTAPAGKRYTTPTQPSGASRFQRPGPGVRAITAGTTGPTPIAAKPGPGVRAITAVDPVATAQAQAATRRKPTPKPPYRLAGAK